MTDNLIQHNRALIQARSLHDKTQFVFFALALATIIAAVMTGYDLSNGGLVNASVENLSNPLGSLLLMVGVGAGWTVNTFVWFGAQCDITTSQHDLHEAILTTYPADSPERARWLRKMNTRLQGEYARQSGAGVWSDDGAWYDAADPRQIGRGVYM